MYNNDFKKVFGELGGNSFAVYSDKMPMNGNSPYYKMFTGVTSDYSIIYQSPGYIYIYNPVPLYLKSVRFYYSSSLNISGNLYGSNNNSNYEALLPNFSFGSADYTLQVNATKQYKYFRFLFNTNTSDVLGTPGAQIGQIKLNATYTTSTLNSITFPTSFTNSNSYGAAFSYIGSPSTNAYISSKTNTGLTLDGVDVNSSSATWIAVGY